MNRIRVPLLVLLWFNGGTAVAGGIGLLTGLMPTDPTLLLGSPFDGYQVPGALLMVVGGAHIAAAAAVQRRATSSWFWAGLAGGAMVVFEAVEFVIIGFHWLQVLYFVSGGTVGALALAMRLRARRGPEGASPHPASPP